MLELLRNLVSRLKYGPEESCTECIFKIRTNIKWVRDDMMLRHYEKFHPDLFFIAHARYGKKED